MITLLKFSLVSNKQFTIVYRQSFSLCYVSINQFYILFIDEKCIVKTLARNIYNTTEQNGCFFVS